jgi:hypothetical protein
MSACWIHLNYYSNPIGFYVKTMSAHGGHIGWRSWSPDTIVKVYYPRIIHMTNYGPSMPCLLMYSACRHSEEDLFMSGERYSLTWASSLFLNHLQNIVLIDWLILEGSGLWKMQIMNKLNNLTLLFSPRKFGWIWRKNTDIFFMSNREIIWYLLRVKSSFWLEEKNIVHPT